jgi:hypothetical protein
VAAERADFSSWQICSPFVAKSLLWYPLACVDRSLKKAKKGKKPGWPLMNADERGFEGAKASFSICVYQRSSAAN